MTVPPNATKSRYTISFVGIHSGFDFRYLAPVTFHVQLHRLGTQFQQNRLRYMQQGIPDIEVKEFYKMRDLWAEAEGLI